MQCVGMMVTANLLLHLVGVLVDEVIIIFLVLVVLLEVLSGLGEVDVATACAPAHDVLLVDLLDLLGAGLLEARQLDVQWVPASAGARATYLTALRVILIVVHGVVSGLALALLDRGLDRSVVGLGLGHVLVLD
jgi:hypothetical protein